EARLRAGFSVGEMRGICKEVELFYEPARFVICRDERLIAHGNKVVRPAGPREANIGAIVVTNQTGIDVSISVHLGYAQDPVIEISALSHEENFSGAGEHLGASRSPHLVRRCREMTGLQLN